MQTDTMIPVKRLRLEHAYNVRDMGGLETSGGAVTAWHTLYRSDALHGLTAQEWKRLEDAGIKTVIDLRSSVERANYSETPPETITYVHCRMQREVSGQHDEISAARKAFGDSLTAGYRTMLTDTPDLLVCALKAVVAGLEKGAVLFHCAAGKDRTGVLAAVLLTLLGADPADIVAEYEVSYTYNKRGFFRFQNTGDDFKRLEPLLHSDRDNMETMIEFFSQIELESYLASYGFTAADIARLKERALIQK